MDFQNMTNVMFNIIILIFILFIFGAVLIQKKIKK